MYGRDITARYKDHYDFDVFNLLITALRFSGYEKYQTIVDFSHVVKDKDSDKMTEIIETNVFLEEFITLKKMETRLRYDHEFLDTCLENMEDYTSRMLERDTRFWDGVRQHKAQIIGDIKGYIKAMSVSGDKISKKAFAEGKGYKYEEVLKFWKEAEEAV